jgi:hypothetical protein
MCVSVPTSSVTCMFCCFMRRPPPLRSSFFFLVVVVGVFCGFVLIKLVLEREKGGGKVTGALSCRVAGLSPPCYFYLPCCVCFRFLFREASKYHHIAVKKKNLLSPLVVVCFFFAVVSTRYFATFCVFVFLFLSPCLFVVIDGAIFSCFFLCVCSRRPS